MSNPVTERHTAHMPSDVKGDLSLFDRFAGVASRLFSRAGFFTFCVLLVLIWAPSYFVIRSLDTWQLIINTATTIVTFLLVALLQNAARRSDRAIHHKLDALADGLADLMEHQLSGDPADLRRDIEELKRAVGLERRSEPSVRRARSARNAHRSNQSSAHMK
jgi:hypothetical protein